MNDLKSLLSLSILSTNLSLLTKELLNYIDTKAYTSYLLLGIATLAFAYNRKKIIIHHLSIIAGIAFGLSMLLFDEAIKRTRNPGTATAVYHSQIALTAIVSFLVLNASLNSRAIFGILTTIIGAILVSFASDKNKNKGKNKGKSKSKSKSKSTSNRKTSIQKYDNTWIPITIVAAILLTVKDIFAVLVTKYNIDVDSYVISQNFFGALIIFIYKYYQDSTILPTFSKDVQYPLFFSGMGATIITGFLLSFTLISLMSKAANPAIPKAFLLLSVALTSFISSYIDKSVALNKQWTGIGIIISGIFAIILNND
jgi:drug/metabolite transporter (DMT)-like permease